MHVDAALPRCDRVAAPRRDWRAIDFISDLHLAEDTPRDLRGLGRAPAPHRRRRAVHPRRPVRGLGRRRHRAERGFEARCAEVLRRGRRASARSRFMAGNRDFLVGDAMLEAQRRACALRRPDRGRRLRRARAAVARRRPVPRRRRLPALPRRGAQPGRGSARSSPGRWPSGSAIGSAHARARAAGAQPRERGGWVDVDADAALALDARPPRRRRWSTATRTGRRATTLAPGAVRHVLSDWDLDGSSAPRAEVLRWQRERLRPHRAARPRSADVAVTGWWQRWRARARAASGARSPTRCGS